MPQLDFQMATGLNVMINLPLDPTDILLDVACKERRLGRLLYAQSQDLRQLMEAGTSVSEMILANQMGSQELWAVNLAQMPLIKEMQAALKRG